MFKKMLFKSVATSAAVGSALAVSLVASPAVVTAAPEIRNVACYAAPAETTTTITMSRAAGYYGAYRTATVQVASEGAPVTSGVVDLVLYDVTTGTVAKAWNDLALRNGQRVVALPRYLRAQRTYMLTANYSGDGCEYADSVGQAKFYTVYRANSRTNADAPNRARGQRPVVTVGVRIPNGAAAGGRVQVVVTRAGKAVASRTVRLSRGAAQVTFPKMRPGRYVAKATYNGSRNYAGSSDSDGFRIRR